MVPSFRKFQRQGIALDHVDAATVRLLGSCREGEEIEEIMERETEVEPATLSLEDGKGRKLEKIVFPINWRN